MAEVPRETSIMQCLSTAVQALSWPQVEHLKEDAFNKKHLEEYLKTSKALRAISAIDQTNIRRCGARPFFGYGSIEKNGSVSISGKVKTDGTFMLGENAFFVENKIIREGRECDVKNSLVQAIEYLNLYNVSAGILLILDDGKGASQTWRSGSEKRLLNLITASYPVCVARIRNKLETEVFSSSSSPI